jgi:hypothetical protein
VIDLQMNSSRCAMGVEFVHEPSDVLELR